MQFGVHPAATQLSVLEVANCRLRCMPAMDVTRRLCKTHVIAIMTRFNEKEGGMLVTRYCCHSSQLGSSSAVQILHSKGRSSCHRRDPLRVIQPYQLLISVWSKYTRYHRCTSSFLRWRWCTSWAGFCSSCWRLCAWASGASGLKPMMPSPLSGSSVICFEHPSWERTATKLFLHHFSLGCGGVRVYRLGCRVY